MLSCEGKIILEKNVKRLWKPFNSTKPQEMTEFQQLISEPFITCANECFEKGEMSSSQKQAVITLIEKKGKDRSFMENWRPICLVNVDAKIMSKVLATRIKMFYQILSIITKVALLRIAI